MEERDGVVGRAVVDEENVEVREALALEMLQAEEEGAGTVEGGEEDGEGADGGS
ncbi:MAG: hypothetical protein NVSMB3_01930 [Acidobacteriaceae bacterium]